MAQQFTESVFYWTKYFMCEREKSFLPSQKLG